ncbi:MAG: hypothetical protein N3F05_02880 [Candidatus Diapherotrites archaeon]|nr:hypothetical protein [Candidatus Diapherotrites archaeon]
MLRVQREDARKEIIASGIKPPASTFPRQQLPYDYAIRRLQKKKVSAKLLSTMALSKDPVIRKAACERLIIEKRPFESLTTNELEKLLRSGNYDVVKRASLSLARRYAKQGRIADLERLFDSGRSSIQISVVEALHLAGEKAAPLANKILNNLSLLEVSAWMDLSKAASIIYAKQGDYNALRGLVYHEDGQIRAGAAHGLAMMGKRGLSLLMTLLRSEHWLAKREAVAAISRIFPGREGISKLVELAKAGNSYDITRAVAQELGKRGEAAIPALMEIMRNSELDRKEPSARALLKIGPKGVKALEKLLLDEDWVTKEYAAEALARYYLEKKDFRALAMMVEKGDYHLRRHAEEAISMINARELLLLTRRPFAAMPHLKEILADIKPLREAATQLKREYEDKFIGIVILGSLAKGYARAGSDIDYALIASDSSAEKRLKEIAKEMRLRLCEHGHFINPFSEQNKTLAPLFCGLFIGDRRALIETQRNVFIRFLNSPEKWGSVREEILNHELKIEKSLHRIVETKSSDERKRKIAAALRVPPPYEEMKKLLGLK